MAKNIESELLKGREKRNLVNLVSAGIVKVSHVAGSAAEGISLYSAPAYPPLVLSYT